MRSFFTIALAVSMALAVTTSASADDMPAPPRVTELPLHTIIGNRQQPAASYILTRSGQRYEVRELRTSFVREVVRSVDRGPF